MKKVIIVMLGIMIFGLAFNAMWDSVPVIKSTTNSILKPTLGKILEWNITAGYVIIILVLQLILTVVQKYTTDQVELKRMRDEQKVVQEELKKYSTNDPKAIEIHKQQLANIPKNFELALKPLIYTAIPIILLFRWFADIFNELGSPEFFGLFGWLGTYIILSIVFSIIFRKILKVY